MYDLICATLLKWSVNGSDQTTRRHLLNIVLRSAKPDMISAQTRKQTQTSVWGFLALVRRLLSGLSADHVSFWPTVVPCWEDAFTLFDQTRWLITPWRKLDRTRLLLWFILLCCSVPNTQKIINYYYYYFFLSNIHNMNRLLNMKRSQSRVTYR